MDSNPYEVQNNAFKAFDDLELSRVFEDKLKVFAYSKGTTMEVMRRVGGIYLRNLCLSDKGMTSEEIDKHDPNK
jgi:hypothetical protein